MLGLVFSLLAGGLVLTWAMDALDGSGRTEGTDEDDEGAEDGGTNQPPDRASEGPDLLTLPIEARGAFDALGGDDTLRVEANTGATFERLTPLQAAWTTQDGDAPLMVNGGPGDDRLLLSGSGYSVSGGDGADVIDLGDARHVSVVAQGSDTVIGGSVGGPTVDVLLRDQAVFQGGDADDYVVNLSAGLVSAGAGNDTVLGMGGVSSVSGGLGDDLLIGTRSEEAFLPSATDLLRFYTSTDADTLDGGEGNDTLRASHGDVVTGGTGADRIGLALGAGGTLAGTEITDFNPAEDRIEIAYDFFGTEGRSTPAPLIGEINVTETPDRDTVITGTGGQVLAVLKGVTGVSVGLQPSDLLPLTDLAGNPTPNADYDVVIFRYFNVTS